MQYEWYCESSMYSFQKNYLHSLPIDGICCWCVQVVERYTLDGTPVQWRRRDLRRGGQAWLGPPLDDAMQRCPQLWHVCRRIG
jgi:hypothetical protein